MAIVSEARFERLALWMLKLTHFFFGPVLFALAIFALANPGSSLYLCGHENTNPNDVRFSVSNLFALLLCFTISGVLTYYYLKFRLKDWFRRMLSDQSSAAGGLLRRIMEFRIKRSVEAKYLPRFREHVKAQKMEEMKIE